MQLKRAIFHTAVLALVFGGCGSNIKARASAESWMQGWFSLRHPSDDPILVSDTQIFLEEDGSAILLRVSECGSNEAVTEMTWETVDATTARVIGDNREYLLRRLDDCNKFERVTLLEDGSEGTVEDLYAGQICLSRGAEDEDCIGSGCVVCNKNWCEGEEPPVACDEDAG